MRPGQFVVPLKTIALAALVVAAMLSLPSGPSGPVPAGAGAITIAVGDNWFCSAAYETYPCDTTVSAGDTVVWDFSGAAAGHTTTECGASCLEPTDTPLWDSGLIMDGSTFEYTFGTAGTYLYYCQVHPFQQGRIIVQAGQATPTRTPTPPRPPTPRPTPTPAGRPGDVNCDASVTSIDAALLLQYGAGLLGSLRCPQNADVNGDGSTNSIDAALVLQYVAGLLDRLPP